MDKTTGQPLEFRLLCGVTTRNVSEASWQPAFRERGALAGAGKPSRWKKLTAEMRRMYAATNALLAEFYRLGSHTRIAVPTAPPRTICLRADEVLNLGRRRQGGRVAVQCGIVWLTGLPSQGDVLLHAGDHFQVSKTGCYVLQALERKATVLWEHTDRIS